MVGNGVCDTVFDGNALVPFAHGMGLISEEIYQVGNSDRKKSPFNSNQISFQYPTDICFKIFL